MTATRPIIIALIVAALIIATGLAIGLAIGLQDEDDCNKDAQAVKYMSASDTYRYAAVATDAKVCSDIGRDILARSGGNAFDAAVAATFCIGILNSHSAGIGGGSFWTLYDKNNNEWHAVISRETAPKAADKNMFFETENRPNSTLGGMAIGVPGEVMGLWEVHNKLGRIPWKTLIKPVITMCLNGVPLSKATHKAALKRLPPLEDKSGFEIYFDGNNNIKPAGSLIKMPKLAETFKKIAEDPFSFYNGSLAEDIVLDIKERDGIIELDDLKDYAVQWLQPTELSMPGNLTVFSTPPPGSGVVLSYILNILSGYNMSPESVATDDAKILTYHRIIEAMKFAFAKRTELGDNRFVDRTDLVNNLTSRTYGEFTRSKVTDNTTHDTAYYEPAFFNTDDHGTVHLSIIDAEGNAVSMTGTINTQFGSKVIGNRTGILFNNEMDDFSTPNITNYFGVPPSEANFIAPGKRPMSSMCPVMVWDDASKKVILSTGASGGTRITTATAQVIMNNIWFGMPLPQAIDQTRLHHQLLPKGIQMYNYQLPEVIKAGLMKKGHIFDTKSVLSVVQGVDVHADGMTAVSDYRKGGEPAGY